MVSPERAERQVCPACGGAGGGPFGRAGSAWDIESYECMRCEGWGYLREAVAVVAEGEPPAVARPGIAKTTPERVAAEKAEQAKRRSSG